VAAFYEDGIRWTLHAYEADVDPGLAAVSGGASPRALVSKIRAVSQNCGGSRTAEISLTVRISDISRLQIIKT
jgi:hypothetical protein